MVERALCMREVPGSIPGDSIFILIGLILLKYVLNVRLFTQIFSSGGCTLFLIGRRKYGSTVRILLEMFLPSRNTYL